MANLSNINGKFVVEQTTGYVGIGTTDPNFLIEAAGTNAELALNAASIYRVRSTSNDEFIITKNGVGDRLTIASGGDATFTGNLIINKGNNGISRISTGSADGSDLGGLTLSGAGGTSSGRGGWISLSGNENGGDARIYTGDAANAKLYLIAGGASGSAIQMQTGGLDALTINHDRSITFNDYGSGSFTGTTAYTLAVDSSGNIIETTDGGGDITGSGTANKVAKFTGAKAIGDGPITFATNDSTFAGIVETDKIFVAKGQNLTHTTSSIKISQENSAKSQIRFYGADSSTAGTLEFMGTSSDGSSGGVRMIIDNAGNIGMGVTPTEKLDIFKDSGSTYIRVYDNSANSEVGLKLQGDAKTWTLQNWGSGGDNLRILNNAGDIVQLWDDNGNVMIGNANDPEKKLHVLGSTTDDTPQVLIQNGSTGDASMTFNVSGQSYVMGIDYDDSKKFKIASSGNLGTNDRVTLLSTGEVGIGTITPLTQLQITSNTTTKLRVNTTGVADSMVEILGYDAGLHIGDNTNGNRWALWNDGPGTSTSLNFGSYALGTWYVPASQVMTMTSSGNVGIGITTPQTTLQVNGSASALNAHFGQGTNNSSGVFGGISLGYSEGGNASYRKVGIVAKAVGDGAARQDLHFLVDTVADSNSAGIADSKMHIQYNTGDVIIDNNLGIGTTSPSSKLTVYGGGSTTSTLELRGGAAGNDNATVSTQQSMTFQIGSGGASGRSYNFNKGGLGYSQGTNLASINDSGTFTATGDVVAYSDERLKSDIKTLDGSKVYNMRGVSFVKDNKQSSGVIAQELEKIAPELVNNDSEYKSVAYGNITGYLIEAIKELKAEIEELKKHSCDCKK